MMMNFGEIGGEMKGAWDESEGRGVDRDRAALHIIFSQGLTKVERKVA